jgi:glycosyltransferase involved in cell wall biosynthesis
MTKLGLRPYTYGDDPSPGRVPVTVIILARDEEPNIRRCVSSVSWADQIVVIDSGSTDDTVSISHSLGAKVVEQPWLGYSLQRDFALQLPGIRHDWVYFVDADEWVSPQLASEVAAQLRAPSCVAFAQRFRIVFQGRWIRHCGWYSGSWITRLVDRRYSKFDGNAVGERICVDGPVHRLRNDLVDEDLKGLAKWLKKHVSYAQLQADLRGRPNPIADRLHMIRSRDNADTRPWSRVVLKDVIFPSVPAKPLALFTYMYVARLGLLDGSAGLHFCFYHAWYEAAINALQAEAARDEKGYSFRRPVMSRR